MTTNVDAGVQRLRTFMQANAGTASVAKADDMQGMQHDHAAATDPGARAAKDPSKALLWAGLGLAGAGALAKKFGVKIPGFGGGNSGDQQPEEKPAPAQPAAKPEDEAASPPMGLANVKRFGMSDPLSFEIGVAKDPAAAEPDLTAQISFKGFDWKLTGLVPRLK